MNNIPRISSELNARINSDGFSVHSNGLSRQMNRPSLNPRLKTWTHRQKIQGELIGNYQQSELGRPIGQKPQIVGEQNPLTENPQTNSLKPSIPRNTPISATQKPVQYKFTEPKSRRGR